MVIPATLGNFGLELGSDLGLYVVIFGRLRIYQLVREVLALLFRALASRDTGDRRPTGSFAGVANFSMQLLHHLCSVSRIRPQAR